MLRSLQKSHQIKQNNSYRPTSKQVGKHNLVVMYASYVSNVTQAIGHELTQRCIFMSQITMNDHYNQLIYTSQSERILTQSPFA